MQCRQFCVQSQGHQRFSEVWKRRCSADDVCSCCEGSPYLDDVVSAALLAVELDAFTRVVLPAANPAAVASAASRTLCILWLAPPHLSIRLARHLLPSAATSDLSQA